jgi:hypothetical protein
MHSCTELLDELGSHRTLFLSFEDRGSNRCFIIRVCKDFSFVCSCTMVHALVLEKEEVLSHMNVEGLCKTWWHWCTMHTAPCALHHDNRESMHLLMTWLQNRNKVCVVSIYSWFCIKTWTDVSSWCVVVPCVFCLTFVHTHSCGSSPVVAYIQSWVLC